MCCCSPIVATVTDATVRRNADLIQMSSDKALYVSFGSLNVRQNLMSKSYRNVCEVCEARYLNTKPYLCVPCGKAYMLCSVCEEFGYRHHSKPQRRKDHCPECNQRLDEESGITYELPILGYM